MDILKLSHVTLAVISITGFVARSLLRVCGSDVLHARWLWILPHILDALFLLTGIMLAIRIEQYPMTQPWLTAKLGALLVYIGLGIVVMRLARTRGQQILALTAAVAVFVYILAVAMTRMAGLGVI